MPTAVVHPAPTPGSSGSSRAWGWVAHLEGGGTTCWADWRDGAAGDRPTGRHWPPGAQQLELLRRLNRAGRPDPELVRRVLTAAAIGRGPHDLALVGVQMPGAFGPKPVDPSDLDDEALLRVAAGLLARELATDHDSSAVSPGNSTVPGQTNRSATRWWRTRYRLAGDPELAAPRRAALVADGRPPGGRGAAVLVLGTDLASMLGHAWVAGAFAEGGPSWSDYLDRWQRRGGVPRRVDLPTITDRWAADPHTGRLEVVLDLPRIPELLRVPAAVLSPAPAKDGPVSAAAADLARRMSTALGLLVPTAERAALLAGLRLRLATLTGRSGPAPMVPAEHRDWVAARAVQMRDRLHRAGHPVVGDLDALLPRWDQPETVRPETVRPETVPPADVSRGPVSPVAASTPLDLAIALLLGQPEPGRPR